MDQIDLLKQKLEVAEIPSDYAEFLQSGEAGKLLDDPDTNLYCYFPIGDLTLKKVNLSKTDWTDFPVHCARSLIEWENQDIIPIATDGHANFLCLDFSDENFGHTYSYNHDTGELIELTDTFSEFLQNPLIY